MCMYVGDELQDQRTVWPICRTSIEKMESGLPEQVVDFGPQVNEELAYSKAPTCPSLLSWDGQGLANLKCHS